MTFAQPLRLLLPLLMALTLSPAFALDLVTAEEAGRPDVPFGTRGVTRGPRITQELPAKDGAAVRAPLQLKVGLKAMGGARIDVSTLQVTYLKKPSVDLTPRLRAGISDGGIELSGVSVPPGQHRLLVRVADSEGRESETVVQLNVAAP
ncbi:hypothetical protein [Roseateles sp.]|uniref:hypothetical protein n=1 Tax=Roseateles sp. TaxID=1971397 RepID=UPI003264D234